MQILTLSSPHVLREMAEAELMDAHSACTIAWSENYHPLSVDMDSLWPGLSPASLVPSRLVFNIELRAKSSSYASLAVWELLSIR